MHERSIVISIKSLNVYMKMRRWLWVWGALAPSPPRICGCQPARLWSNKMRTHLCEIWRHLVVCRHQGSTVAAENKRVFLKQMYVGTKQTGSGFWDNIYATNNSSTFILTSNKNSRNPWVIFFATLILCPFTVNEVELNPSSVHRDEAARVWLLPLMPPVWGEFRTDSQPSCRSYI